MNRILFTLVQTFKHYTCIALKKRQRIRSITALDVAALRARKVQCLVLDFDGVLAAHGEVDLHPLVKDWLATFCQQWPQQKIVILSNKPFNQRIERFNRQFKEIVFCTGVAKKPYPDGLNHIARQRQLQPHELLLVDDRLLTGMLACCLSGAQGILIQNPYKQFFKRPVHEFFFALLRTLERLFIRG